ncbi:MAG TPA: hypothetical protein VD962_04480 [Rubricoccaceae bacterium]|nr:hypothetical protein [Rubricoccaceae bacterium]
MSALRFDLFTAASDVEAAQYRILAGLQEAHEAFTHNRVYPHLADLVTLRRTLADLLDRVDALRQHAPGRLRGIDWEAGMLLYEPEEGEEVAPFLVEPLARWALPLLDEQIEEGRALFEFAAEQAALMAVGLVPPYQDEGFLLVPDDEALLALRYRASVLTGHDGRYRSLATTPVPVTLSPLTPPSAWKEALAEAYPDLPAPATYRVESAVPLPLEATVLPIAKRKLLRLIAERGEA